jgi:hypothetical protein
MVRPSGRQICDPVEYLRRALVLAPNGILLTANGDAVYDDVSQPRETVEFARMSRFVHPFNVYAAEGGRCLGSVPPMCLFLDSIVLMATIEMGQR